jgi:hypothetical protein
MEIPSIPDAAGGVAREAFAALLRGVIARVEAALAEGVARGEFAGDPARTAVHLVSVARGLVVLERAFGDEAQLRAIAAEAIEAALAPRG